jgi:thioredoxin reductase
MNRIPLNPSRLPIAVIGAGPIGLAAAGHLLANGLTPLIFEAGSTIAAHLESVRHVRLFSPWRYNVDRESARLLAKAGWSTPPQDALPTAGELIDEYLVPLSRVPAIADALRLGHKATQVAREGFDKMKTEGRERAAFVVRTLGPGGMEQHRVWSVIDASGTWSTPNPLGANGLPATGEARFASHIAYGMPDVLGRNREHYASKSVVVAGAGHSAVGSLIALAELAKTAPQTRIAWIVRGTQLEKLYGGGAADKLPARGALGTQLKALIDAGRIEVHTGFRIESVVNGNSGVDLLADDGRRVTRIDRIIASTGSRPDLSLARELRIKLDPWLESTEALAPLIDPNVHSCGTVRPHGHRELAHPEARFYAVGAKSYGRAPNFLLATGYEQARSVVAALAGDLTAADDVQLELPQTGVCSTQFAQPKAEACCGEPAPAESNACCVKDAVAKSEGRPGCGCGPALNKTKAPIQSGACC